MIKFWDYLRFYKKNKKEIEKILDKSILSGQLILGKEVEKFENNNKTGRATRARQRRSNRKGRFFPARATRAWRRRSNKEGGTFFNARNPRAAAVATKKQGRGLFFPARATHETRARRRRWRRGRFFPACVARMQLRERARWPNVVRN